MEIGLIAANAGAVVTLGLGLMGLLKPAWVASFTCIRPAGDNGVSEIRATYGGLFIALGLTCLLSQEASIFCVVGLAWVGAAIGRIFSVVIDRNIHSKNISGVVFEAIIGFLLLFPTFG